MKGSAILSFLFGYKRHEEGFLSSNIKEAERVFSDRVINGLGRSISGKILNNPIARFFTKLKGSLAFTTTRSWGSLLLSFSLVTLLVNFANYYINSESIPPFSLVVASVLGIISIPLLLFDLPLSEAIRESVALDVLFHEVFCIKRLPRGSKFAAMPTLVSTLIGIILGTLGFFLPLQAVLIAAVSLIYVLLATSSPEFSMMMTLLVLPYLPLLPHAGTVLAVLTLFGAASFAFKVVIGKRSYHFEEYDVLIFLFLLFVLVSGIFNQGIDSFANALLLIALALSYPVASNLISNKRIAEGAINVILFSSVPAAILGIIKFFIMPSGDRWTDTTVSSSITSRADATFGNPNVYAVFLIVALIFSAAFALDASRGKARLIYLFVFAVNLVAMLLTYTRGAWVALILSLLGALIIKAKRAPKLLLIPVALIPLGLLLLPSSFTERLFSIFGGDSSLSHRFSIWRSSLEMVKENPLFGVGIGESSFTSEFLTHAEEAVSAPHSHNLFLEIACEAGIGALLIFVFLLLVRIIHIASYSRYTQKSSVGSGLVASATVIFALIVFGLGDYIWYNHTMFFMFWFIFGFCSAALRISKKEHDEEYSPKSSQSSPYEASVDISVSD